MGELPDVRIQTSRLLLRPFEAEDARAVSRLAGDMRVSESAATIPYPYSAELAQSWIEGHGLLRRKGLAIIRAIESPDEGLVGCAELRISSALKATSLGYWIGFPYWGRGYATEAGRALVRYALGELRLLRVRACCLARNLASGRVLEKTGLRYLGESRFPFLHRGNPERLSYYGLWASELGERGAGIRCLTRSCVSLP